MSTTSKQFESDTFRSNFLKLVVAAQDYDILHLSHIPEIPGGPKLTFSSPETFKLLSGEPKVIQLVTWYHVLFHGPWSIHFLFQNTRNRNRNETPEKAVCNKALNTFDTTTCRPAARLRRWLINWYPAIQKQRETHCDSLSIYVSLDRAVVLESFRMSGLASWWLKPCIYLLTEYWILVTESHMILQDNKSSPSVSGQNTNRSMFSIRLDLLTKTTWKLTTPWGIVLVLWVLVQVWCRVALSGMVIGKMNIIILILFYIN